MSKLIYYIGLFSFYALGQVAPFGLPENISLKEDTLNVIQSLRIPRKVYISNYDKDQFLEKEINSVHKSPSQGLSFSNGGHEKPLKCFWLFEKA